MATPAAPAERISAQLRQAELDRAAMPPLTQSYPGLSAADAYAVQDFTLQNRLAGGEQLVGRKIGLTSKAMQDLLGVSEPDYGFLLASMLVPSGGTIRRSDLMQPRVEPEIAFWLAEDLHGPNVTAEQVLKATRGVAPSLEIVDSRIADWKITLADTIADNGSSARAVVDPSQAVPLGSLDLAHVDVVLLRNGDAVGRGTGADVLGHPALAVAWLANALAAYGQHLRAGDLVLPGAMCAAVWAHAGDTFTAEFSGLGRVVVRFGE